MAAMSFLPERFTKKVSCPLFLDVEGAGFKQEIKIMNQYEHFHQQGHSSFLVKNKYRKIYRTKDGCADYEFSFEKRSDGSWRVYIENQPSYRNRSEDGHSTHRLTNGNRKYVCWTKQLDSLDEAKTVAQLWADKTQEYIRTGQRF